MSDPVRTNVTISVNGREIEATRGEVLIEAIGRAGEYVPRFCYHPRMEPVGVCRMCLVEVDGPRGPTLQPACFLRVNDGMNVCTNSEKVKKAQDGVLEFLLANHPLDCPVCDKGGECPLQDQALAHGSGETRFIEEKRHYVKPISIGENILLDRERCIQCSRCTRFSAEVAGDSQIAFSGRGDLIEVAPSPVEPFGSVFSGNTVQICPVGALTAKPYRFSARPWDLEQVESTCTGCSVGCRVAVQSSGNRLTRVLGVDSDPVNHGWLCDKGRFTLDSIDGNEGSTDLLNAATRIKQPLVRKNGQLVEVSWGEALSRAADLLREANETPSGVGAIGGASLTNEGAFAWERFLRGVLGTDNIDAQFGDGLDAGLMQALPKATIDEAASACTVVTLTGDLQEELPVLFLRLRESFTKKNNSLVELISGSSALSNVAKVSLQIRPGEAHVVARALGSIDSTPNGLLVTEEQLSDARRLIGDTGEGVVFVVGRANFAERPEIIESAIRYFATRYPQAKFLPALRRSNVIGALDMGLSPQMLPGRGFNASAKGRSTEKQLSALRSGAQKAVLLLGGCVLGNVLDPEGGSAALENSSVIAVTGHGGKSLAYADVVLPATVAHERLGTVTNIEGRVTSVVPKIVAPGSAWSDVAIASELAELFGQNLGLSSVEETSRAIEESVGYPALSVLTDDANDGVVVGRSSVRSPRRALDPMAFPGIRSVETAGLGSHAGTTSLPTAQPGAAQAQAHLDQLATPMEIDVPFADQYSLRVNVSRRLYDNGIAVQGSPALHNLIPTTTVYLNAADLDRLGAASGTIVKVTGPNGSVELPVESNSGVPRGVAEIVFGSVSDSGWRNILDTEAVFNQVRLETR